MKKPLLLTLATAVSLPLASAQEERKPENPPRPADAERPPGPRPDGPRERRPESDRPGFEPGDRRPDGERGSGQRRPDAQRLDSPSPEGRRPEGDRRDGPRPEGDRRDGQRFEVEVQGAPGRERLRVQGSSAMPRPQKPTPYLGVVTVPAPPPVAAQLGLPEGFGLVVEEVVPDSPAARAGVQRYDVVKQFNDQQLVDPNQLAALVRSAGKDAEVSLTIVRKGSEQKVSVKVGERLLPERRPFSGVDQLMPNLAPLRERAERSAHDMQERMEKWKDQFGDQMKEYNERMKDYGNRMREFQERATRDRQNPEGPQPQPPKAPEPPTPPAPPRFDSSFAPAPADVLRQVRPGGAPGVRVEQDGNVTLWNTANARAIIKDDDGEVEVRSENGKRAATARDREGKVIFTGPIDTEEQRAALPEGVRRKLNRMEVRSRTRVDGPAPAGATASGDAIAFEVAVPPPAGEREIQ